MVRFQKHAHKEDLRDDLGSITYINIVAYFNIRRYLY